MSITIEEVLAAGFREFSVPPIWNCDRFFQKWVYTHFWPEGQKFYALNLRYYDWRNVTGAPMQEGWDATVRLYADQGLSFDLNLMWEPEHTLQFIEEFYAEAAQKLGCVADPHNNDS